MTAILKSKEHGVLTLTINRVDKKNALTADMYAALAEALSLAAASEEVRVVLLQGHETVFSAGNDIADFLQQPPASPDSAVSRFLRGIAVFPKPLLASVCGPAVGVGTTITANGVATRSTAWATSLTATHTITFASANAMRYFFNGGGRITWAGDRSGGSVSDKNTSWTNLLTACGTLNWTTGTSTQTIAGTSYTGTTKIGGSGTPTTLLTTVGFYDFLTTDQEVFKQFSSTYLYTVNFVSINVKVNALPGSGTVMTLTVLFSDVEADPEENVDGTLTSTITAVAPSTTYLTEASWGTPTLASSITGS